MGIIEEQLNRKDIEVSKSLAQKLYDKQVKDITNISHLDGYKEIKAYWERVREGATKELETVGVDNLRIVQLKRSIANDFVVFLNNLESAKETRNKAKA